MQTWAGALRRWRPRPLSAATRLALSAALASALCLSGLWLWLALSPALPLLEGIAFSPLVLDRHGTLLRMGLTPDEKFRARITLTEIAPHAVHALLLYEDRHFYQHPGVNPLALGRATLSMLGGGRRMGGSTITMQVARLRYGLDTTSFGGKLRQMLLALRLERHHSKRDILEAYFCLAPYGGNVEGIAAAARIYFGRPPLLLSLPEALALTPVPQNPVRRWPLAGRDFANARVRMHALWNKHYAADLSGQVSPMAPLAAQAPRPLRILGPASLPFEAPHVSAALLSAQGTPTSAPQKAQAASILRTTLDLPLQKLVEQHLSSFAARGRVYGLHNAAALLLHWPSMEIRALAGSANFNDIAILGQVDGTLARRSPGSTLKPFIYALALDQGLIHPQSLLVDSPRSFGGYDPENFDRSFQGPLPAQQALRNSRNIPAIWLASRLSPDLYAFLQRASVNLPHSAEHYGLSLVLGGAEVSLRQLVELYAMLPNKGVWRPAQLQPSEDMTAGLDLLSPEAAVLTLRMMEEPGRALRTRRGLVPHRYKTGTSNRFRDAWTVGVLGPYILGVWAGNFDNSPNPLLIGGDVAAPLYEDIATSLAQREALNDLVPDLHSGLNIVRLPVCTDTGDLDTSLCPNTTQTWYIPGRSPTRPSGVYRRILVDARTGLRACQPSEHTQEEIWEFWSTDLQALFARAGVSKPAPPPFGPECSGMEEGGGLNVGMGLEADMGAGGSQPRILSPRDGVIYQRRVGDEHKEGTAIPLSAGVAADAHTVFWFVNDGFMGHCAPNASLLWQPENGVHTIRIVDNLGRAAVRRVRVETLP